MIPQKATRILKKLKKQYPNAGIALNFDTPLELLVATMLSAQCTDKRVNIVTKALFKKYRCLADYAMAKSQVLEKDIHSTGFYRNKAKNIIAAAKLIKEDFDGKVPENMIDLLKLAGVARKTANIVLSEGFSKIDGIAVDTHVKRLSERLDLSKSHNPERIEVDLMRLFAKRCWPSINRLFIAHGRAICKARNPSCLVCTIGSDCPSRSKYINKS
jgi:endonuclease III